MVDGALMQYVKELLGFYDEASDTLLTPLILSAENYVQGAGLKKPEDDEQRLALYKTAVATQVRILHDGDPKGDLAAVVAGIVAQARGDD